MLNTLIKKSVIIFLTIGCLFSPYNAAVHAKMRDDGHYSGTIVETIFADPRVEFSSFIGKIVVDNGRGHMRTFLIDHNTLMVDSRNVKVFIRHFLEGNRVEVRWVRQDDGVYVAKYVKSKESAN